MRAAHTSRVVGGMLWLAVIGADDASAQAASERAGRRVILPRAQEIALARSAAPAGVSSGARVLVFTDSGFVVAEPGTSAVTCLVDRSWVLSLEPICYNDEGAATILPMEIRRTELRHRGRAEAEIEREIADGLAAGRYRLPTRAAMSYMMSSAQVLYGDDGKRVGKWRPHLMLYQPYLTNAAVGLPAAPDMRVGTVFDEGRPGATLVLVMGGFIDAAGAASVPTAAGSSPAASAPSQ